MDTDIKSLNRIIEKSQAMLERTLQAAAYIRQRRMMEAACQLEGLAVAGDEFAAAAREIASLISESNASAPVG